MEVVAGIDHILMEVSMFTIRVVWVALLSLETNNFIVSFKNLTIFTTINFTAVRFIIQYIAAGTATTAETATTIDTDMNSHIKFIEKPVELLADCKPSWQKLLDFIDRKQSSTGWMAKSTN